MSYEKCDEVTVSDKYLFKLADFGHQHKLLLIETDGGNRRVLTETILSPDINYLPNIAFYSKKLERVYLQMTEDNMLNGSTTMTFNEFSLKDGLASVTGHAENTIYNQYSTSCKNLRKIHFDDKNGLLRLLETDNDTAIVYTWKMDNFVL